MSSSCKLQEVLKNCALSLLDCATTKILGLILDYWRFHQVMGRSNVIQCT